MEVIGIQKTSMIAKEYSQPNVQLHHRLINEQETSCAHEERKTACRPGGNTWRTHWNGAFTAYINACQSSHAEQGQ